MKTFRDRAKVITPSPNRHRGDTQRLQKGRLRPMNRADSQTPDQLLLSLSAGEARPQAVDPRRAARSAADEGAGDEETQEADSRQNKRALSSWSQQRGADSLLLARAFSMDANSASGVARCPPFDSRS
jgi:hypothetical protein